MMTNPPGHLLRDKWTALSGPLSAPVKITSVACLALKGPYDGVPSLPGVCVCVCECVCTSE
jgi:hypothetical protein